MDRIRPHATIIVQDVNGNFFNVPLHRIYLTSELVSGLVEVRVMPFLTMKGMSILLGNELAGGRVITHPRVVLEPVASIDTKNI